MGTAAHRYWRVYWACLRNCLARELEFRSSFAFSAGSTVLWAVFSMLLAGLVFSNVREVAGWDLNRMFVLTGSFLIVEGLSSALFEKNMQRLSDMVNKGELDFVLIRPISSQFLVSIRYVDFGDLPTALVGIGYVVVGVGRLGITPGPLEIAAYLLMLASALLALYALWFMAVTLVLWTGRINNISAVMPPFISMARMPSDIYRGLAKPLLTYGLPIAAIATLPAKALLGVLEPTALPYQVALTLALLWLSSRFWRYSLRRYTSASS
ncbi:MAG: ABC-2 family transporter protein [Chloroflexi bacterium]|nr:ABC-2 family transporter protein [Chloroflexota bacterium]